MAASRRATTLGTRDSVEDGVIEVDIYIAKHKMEGNHPLHALMLGAMVGFLQGPLVGAAATAAIYAYMKKFGHALPGASPDVVVAQPHTTTSHTQHWVVTDS